MCDDDVAERLAAMSRAVIGPPEPVAPQRARLVPREEIEEALRADDEEREARR
jgi:hypothetical protein